MPSLIAFRAIQGLGGGGLLPLATIILSDLSTPAERPQVLSWTSGTWGVAGDRRAAAGLAVRRHHRLAIRVLAQPADRAAHHHHGRAAPEGAPRRSGTAGRIDLVGAALLAAGIGAGMAALIQWHELRAGMLLVLAAAAAALLLLFAWRERGAAEPMLAASLLRRPLIAAANASTLVCGALIIAGSAFLPPAVQGVLGQPAVVAGLVLGGDDAELGRGVDLARPGAVAGCRCGRWRWPGSLLVVAGMGGLLLPGGLPVMLATCVPMGAGLGISSLVFTRRGAIRRGLAGPRAGDLAVLLLAPARPGAGRGGAGRRAECRAGGGRAGHARRATRP